MTEIIFTYRPLSWKPISWVNALTRFFRRSPFDHVAGKHAGFVYESVAGEGVHKIPYEQWVKGREGSYLLIYQIKSSEVSWFMFDQLEGRKYDYKANILYLFGLRKRLKKNATKEIYCSELWAYMLKRDHPWDWPPDELERTLRDNDSYLTEI